MTCFRWVKLFLLVLAGVLNHEATANELPVSTREELSSALSSAKPGDRILLAPGLFRGGLSQANLQGTAEQPIVIEAADPENVPIIRGGSNGLQLSRPMHVQLKNLVFEQGEGNGLNLDDGGDRDHPVGHIKLTDIVVRDVGPEGNHDGIKLSGLENIQIENCTIESWGSAGSAIDMVGCHHAVVSNCTFHNARSEQASGVQTKGGSSDVVVRHCRFENAGGRALNIGGSTGAEFFRLKTANFEARNITIEDCTVIGSAIAFVGVDGATVRYNTIYRPRAWAARILQETQSPQFIPCRNGRFEHNIVAFYSDDVRTAVNVGPHTEPETFQFKSNVWYCIDRPEATKRIVRLPVEELDGTYDVAPRFRSPEEGDLRLKPDSKLNAGPREE